MLRRALTGRALSVGLMSLALAVGLVACSSKTTGGSVAPAIDVKASEFTFEPATIRVAAGSVTFHVTNGGEAEHEFEILKGDQTVSEIEGLVPGIDMDLTVSLAAGDYTYACHLPGHFEQGMKGTLTVTP
ncbi:MAG: cupredoxin domain-containing protein [Candidatus Limnocylindrales bacterium]